MDQKYLPIGSVCTLKGKNKKVMITGYYSVSFNGNLKINDYKGCAYPEGLLLPEFSYSFNHNDIEKVDFIGFKNDEYNKFKGLLNRLTGNIDEESASKFHKENDMFLTSNSTYSKLLFDENGVVMIADPVVESSKKVETQNWPNIKFDEKGYVISTGTDGDVNNPFYREYETKSTKEQNSSDWKIFNNIKFDENGTVISADNSINEKKNEMLNEIKFDENGTVISVKGEELKQEQRFNQYRFDENGTVIALDDTKLEEVSVIPNSNKEYKFDANGNVIAAPIEQSAKSMSTNIKFDENGIVVSE